MKKNRILIIGSGLLLVLAMFVGCGGRSGEKEYSKAIQAWDEGDLVQARALLEKATGRLSGNVRKSMAFNKLGLVLWQLDEPKAAAAAFDDACALSETITDARLNLAMAQFHSDDFDGALKSINMYLGENPKNKTALALKSLIAAKKRDWAQSTRIMAEAVAATPNDPAAQNALALAELNHGQGSAQVISRLKKITLADPDYAPALYNLGVIHEQWLHDKDAALQYYQAYVRKAGGSGSHAEAARNAIARLDGSGTAASSSNPEDAVKFMKEGDRLYGEKKYAAALAQYQQAVVADPSRKDAYYRTGMASFNLSDYAKVQEACRQALSLDPSYADARYLLSYSYLQQQKWDSAEREAKELSRVDPERGSSMLKHIANARR